MGAKIKIESQENVGTQINIEIKFEKSMMKEKQIIDESIKENINNELTLIAQERFAQFRILIADDIEINQTVIKSYLKKIGFKEITIVNNGLEALDISKKIDFDMIFMDCNMPVMDGFLSSKEIKLYYNNKNHYCHIFAVSALNLDNKSEEIKNSGFDDFINKPIQIQELKKFLISKISLKKLNEAI